MLNDGMEFGGDSGSTQSESTGSVGQESQQESSDSGSATFAESSSDEVELAEEQEEQQPAYQPNFRYRAFQEEKEFPEWARSFVTSKELEDNLRSVFCKADGLDGLKPRYQELRNQYSQLSENWNTLRHYAQNDLHRFFEATGISRDKLVDWLIKAEEVERDPQRKAAFEAQRQAQMQHEAVQRQMQQQQQQLHSLMAQNHQIQLRTVFNDPDVGEFASAFDEKLGEGAFMAHVYNVGNQHFLETGKNLSPAEATAIVVRQYHKLVDSGASSSVQGASRGVAADGMPVVPPAKPIPSLGNGAAATGKSKVQSLDDLKRIAESY